MRFTTRHQQGIATVPLIIIGVVILGAVLAVLLVGGDDQPSPESTSDTSTDQAQTTEPTEDETTPVDDSDEAPATSNPTTPSGNNDTPTQPAPKTVTVTYTSSFSPSTVTINAGDTVKFVNDSNRDIQPSSDNHPSHTIYPEFEAPDIPPGSSWSFTFTKLGTWGYHDHNLASKTGTVVVQ